MNQRSRFSFGMMSFLCATLLAAQCAWLLLAGFTQRRIAQLPTDIQDAAIASQLRDNATWTAWIGFMRGQLWADAAYTHADLLWTNSTANDVTPASHEALAETDRALREAPHLSAAWLLRAGLAAHYPALKANAEEALRMSYYTGPSELALVPLRSSLATQMASLDAELQELAARDLHILVAHNEKRAIANDYRLATPAGKHLIEKIVGEVDRNFATDLRTGPL